jgi:CRISPR-associated protein Cas1
MPVLYLVEQGASLRKEGDLFTVTKDNEILQKVPAAKVEQVVIFGNVNITTPVIHYLLREGIDCVFCSSTGKYHGRLFSTESKFGLLRQAQLQAASNTETRFAIARQMIRGKLSNLRTMLMRYLRESADTNIREAVDGLQQSIGKVEHAADIASLQGIEGYSGVLYYGAFRNLLKYDLGFRARVRRPPRDPVNLLLSFGYTLLVYAAQAAVRTVGLDPFIGFLHSTEYSKPSLALDIMEEFRPVIVDSIVLRVINSRILTEKDFEKASDYEGMVRLTPEAIKTFLHHYEERMQTTIINPVTNTHADYRRSLELQARQIARIVTGQQRSYKPFVVK